MVRISMCSKHNEHWNGDDLLYKFPGKEGLLCSNGDYSELWHFGDTEMERSTVMVRGKMIHKFPRYFRVSRHSFVVQNQFGELIYNQNFYESQHILTWRLKGLFANRKGRCLS